MKDYLEAERQDKKRRRRERYIIGSLILVISILTTYLGIKVFDLGLDLPIANSILIFALIDINVMLLLLLLFLTVRNLVKLLFERRKGIMGSRLRTKLVVAFVTLSLLPTAILFFVSVQFISTSIEYWFNLPVERSLKNSLEVGQGYYDRITDDLLTYGNSLSRLITYHGYTLLSKTEEVEKLIEEKRVEYRLAAIKVFSKSMQLRAASKDEKLDLSPFKEISVDALRKSFEKGSDAQLIQSSPHGQLLSGIVPIFSRTESKAVVGLVVLQKFVPGAFVNRLNAVSRGLEEFKQFKLLKKPIKIIHLITLSIVTLLIIFSSVWFGFYLSKGITVPIQELAEGTNRIASGDYDFFIDLESKDEIGILVNSFNRMTMDLRNSKMQLEKANRQLMRSNIELEQRRLYMEIVLASVAAGVVSAGADGRILTINKSAEKMLNIKAERFIGKHYREILSKEHMKVISNFIRDEALFKKGFMEKQVRVSVGDKTLTLLVSLNVLRDYRGKYLGLVAVFEDLTQIERAQRMAAWREVARRIAHEVKNPLTPIQLSAQRLKKKYGPKIGRDDGKVFEECTNMIIDQVEGLKRLVNEFSSYARMPASNPKPNNIKQIIKESMSLFTETQKDIKFVFRDKDEVPEFKVDKEQIKRVMINLLDNAIDAIDEKGEILVGLSYDKVGQAVTIEVADDGKGIPPEHKNRLFEPYFSTKKHGTGLGLAIASSIISEHNGTIRVKDRHPRGTSFIIELPVKV
ncbi:MAG: HAMP domain-containing protein [Deltaproteobacteria bacterium]|nr:HAMP domain-containing protein [Deltaproteobacteria bacterium]MBW1935315.1 HAMP domain-containing protein [Deltaproteobacteria bacterium]MBW1978860.1 HAMP domain-containing protein [Deltaproteobacteria bacterium]MBW2045334.1 HAMP domain-containing protein [Deltaproteobacteria bacterium]MBW2299717.1 HAMP domain-containing protein [Deltaproteobacteria bacterium]